LKNKEVISEAVALNDLEAFVNEWVEKPIEKDKLKDFYPNMFEALMSGNLVIEDKVPVYTLVKPVENTKGEISVSTLNFRTRISPMTQANLAKGLDLLTDELNFGLNCICYIIDQPKAIVDHFRQKDYSAVREISSLFTNAG
jgi:hypothetical protein